MRQGGHALGLSPLHKQVRPTIRGRASLRIAKGPSGRPMPTLFRFLYWCALIAGVIYAILFALAYLVEPTPRDATIEIPSERTNPPVQ